MPPVPRAPKLRYRSGIATLDHARDLSRDPAGNWTIDRAEYDPTAQQIAVLRAYVLTGSRKAAAASLGLSISTVSQHLFLLYQRLGAETEVEALLALGWLVLP